MKLKALTSNMDNQAMGSYFAALVEDLDAVRTEGAARGILVSMCQVSLLLGSSHAEENGRLILALRSIVQEATTDETVLLAQGLIRFHREPRPLHRYDLLALAREYGLTNK